MTATMRLYDEDVGAVLNEYLAAIQEPGTDRHVSAAKALDDMLGALCRDRARYRYMRQFHGEERCDRIIDDRLETALRAALTRHREEGPDTRLSHQREP